MKRGIAKIGREQHLILIGHASASMDEQQTANMSWIECQPAASQWGNFGAKLSQPFAPSLLT